MKLPQKSIELTNHQCEIHCIKYSSDGMYVMTASSNKIRLFNVQTGEIIKIYQEHGKAVLGIAIPQNTSDNSRYASCSADRSVFLWDVVTGKVLRRYQEHTARVNALDFNRDATLIASASYDSLVMLWDCRAESRKPIQILNNAKDSVESLVINGTEIICGSTDGVIRSYDVRTGRLVEDKVGSPITYSCLTNDKNCIIASSLDSHIRLFDKSNGELLASYHGHSNSNFRLIPSITYNDSHIVCGSEDGQIFFWDLVEANVVGILDGHSKPVSCIAYHPSQHSMISGAQDGSMKLWLN